MATLAQRRGTRLRAEREARGWSRRTLADKAGTSESNIARVELYGHRAGLDQWDAWSDVLEVPLSRLLEDSEAAA